MWADAHHHLYSFWNRLFGIGFVWLSSRIRSNNWTLRRLSSRHHTNELQTIFFFSTKSPPWVNTWTNDFIHEYLNPHLACFEFRCQLLWWVLRRDSKPIIMCPTITYITYIIYAYGMYAVHRVNSIQTISIYRVKSMRREFWKVGEGGRGGGSAPTKFQFTQQQ